jgi:hypothetical protein
MECKPNEVVNGFIQIGYEYELTDFLFMASQDSLNASSSDQDDVTLDEDVAGHVIDAALSVSSFFAGCINEPVNGCHSGDYGRPATPKEADEEQRELSEEEEAKRILGTLSWTDVISDQILVGLGLRPIPRIQYIGIEGNHEGSLSTVETGDVAAEEVRLLLTNLNGTDGDAPADTQEPEISEPENAEELSEVASDDTEQEMHQTANAPIDNEPQDDVAVDTRDVLQEPRDVALPAAGSVETEGTSSPKKESDGKSNDVLKKLVAKCLAMNKRNGACKAPAKKLQLEPESDPQYTRPESPFEHCFVPVGSVNSSISESDVQSIEVVTREVASVAESETREPCASSDNMGSRSASHDPPASSEPHSNRLRSMKLKMNTFGRSAAVVNSVQPHTNSPRPEQTPMELRMKRSTRIPDYYSQPPRPEVPFSKNKKSTKRQGGSSQGSSSSRQMKDEDRSETAKSSQFKDSILSSSAILRRRYYKEMLLRERAAQRTAVE